MRRLPTLGLAALLAVAPGFVGESPAQSPRAADGVLARTLITVADDFIVDVYHNGVKVADDRRELVAEVFGATVERIKVDVRPGDWLVFNVVNNRLRWRGASYFAVSGRGDSGVAFTTELDSGRWSCCDDPGQVAQFIADRDRFARNLATHPIEEFEVAQFIADRDRFADHRALPVANPWDQGDSLMARHADGWAGKPVWGGSRNTWIKFIAR